MGRSRPSKVRPNGPQDSTAQAAHNDSGPAKVPALDRVIDAGGSIPDNPTTLNNLPPDEDIVEEGQAPWEECTKCGKPFGFGDMCDYTK